MAGSTDVRQVLSTTITTEDAIRGSEYPVNRYSYLVMLAEISDVTNVTDMTIRVYEVDKSDTDYLFHTRRITSMELTAGENLAWVVDKPGERVKFEYEITAAAGMDPSIDLTLKFVGKSF